MAKSTNLWIGLGVLGRDAEVVQTPGGKSVTKFSMATSNRYKKGDEWLEDTDWHNIISWNAENLAQYLTKGKQVQVIGRYSNRAYEKDGKKQYFYEVVASDISLCGGKSGGDNSSRQSDNEVDGEDVPF